MWTLPHSCLCNTQKDVSVCFSFDVFILGERETFNFQFNGASACVHLYSEMISPHRPIQCTNFHHSGATHILLHVHG